jgi:hypothetical protein
MIDSTIIHVASSLNQYLRRKFDLSEDIAVVSNIVDQDGSVIPDINNKIVIFLVNVEQETAPGLFSRIKSSSTANDAGSYPPVHLNMYLMFSANFSGNNYTEALKFLSCVISYFQRNPVFFHHNSPDLGKEVDKLIFDIENLNIKDLSSLWTIINGKYMPSILYKVRMITYDAKDLKAQPPPVDTVVTSVQD